MEVTEILRQQEIRGSGTKTPDAYLDDNESLGFPHTSIRGVLPTPISNCVQALSVSETNSGDIYNEEIDSRDFIAHLRGGGNEEDIRCKICWRSHDQYEYAVMLCFRPPQGHGPICKDCLHQLLAGSTPNNIVWPKCPICRKAVDKIYRGLAEENALELLYWRVCEDGGLNRNYGSFDPQRQNIRGQVYLDLEAARIAASQRDEIDAHELSVQALIRKTERDAEREGQKLKAAEQETESQEVVKQKAARQEIVRRHVETARQEAKMRQALLQEAESESVPEHVTGREDNHNGEIEDEEKQPSLEEIRRHRLYAFDRQHDSPKQATQRVAERMETDTGGSERLEAQQNAHARSEDRWERQTRQNAISSGSTPYVSPASKEAKKGHLGTERRQKRANVNTKFERHNTEQRNPGKGKAKTEPRYEKFERTLEAGVQKARAARGAKGQSNIGRASQRPSARIRTKPVQAQLKHKQLLRPKPSSHDHHRRPETPDQDVLQTDDAAAEWLDRITREQFQHRGRESKGAQNRVPGIWHNQLWVDGQRIGPPGSSKTSGKRPKPGPLRQAWNAIMSCICCQAE